MAGLVLLKRKDLRIIFTFRGRKNQLNSLILAGFLKVTAPSSLLLKLLLLVIGGGRAGGSFRVVPRVRRSEIEELLNVKVTSEPQFNYTNAIEDHEFSLQNRVRLFNNLIALTFIPFKTRSTFTVPTNFGIFSLFFGFC